MLECLEPLQAAEGETNPVTLSSLRNDTLKVQPEQTKQHCKSFGAFPTDVGVKHVDDWATDTSQLLGTEVWHF